MKDKLKTGGETLRGMIKTGGDVVDKALDKSSDVAGHMINSATGLMSKLSDDIGIMADRILTMEERIGLMADRIVHTEKLMAKLTAALADKDLDVSLADLTRKPGVQPPILAVPTTEISEGQVPELRVSGDPSDFLLYVSASPLFRDVGTVVSRIEGVADYPVAWLRSVKAISDANERASTANDASIVVSVAVKTISEGAETSAISNSIDVTVCRVDT